MNDLLLLGYPVDINTTANHLLGSAPPIENQDIAG